MTVLLIVLLVILAGGGGVLAALLEFAAAVVLGFIVAGIVIALLAYQGVRSLLAGEGSPRSRRRRSSVD